jgi:hypothetical protein
MAMTFTPAGAAGLALLGVAGLVAPVVAQARVYASVESAQKTMFPGVALHPHPFVLTPDQQRLLRDASSVSLPFQGNRIWKAADGGWFVVDEVVGKHEMITYAVGIGPDGRIAQVAILDYHESYGYEVADEAWRRQFAGKTAASPLRLDKDIENISGATLSSKHVTDGVRRVMTLYDAVLRNVR